MDICILNVEFQLLSMSDCLQLFLEVSMHASSGAGEPSITFDDALQITGWGWWSRLRLTAQLSHSTHAHATAQAMTQLLMICLSPHTSYPLVS